MPIALDESCCAWRMTELWARNCVKFNTKFSIFPKNLFSANHFHCVVIFSMFSAFSVQFERMSSRARNCSQNEHNFFMACINNVLPGCCHLQYTKLYTLEMNFMADFILKWNQSNTLTQGLAKWMYCFNEETYSIFHCRKVTFNSIRYSSWNADLKWINVIETNSGSCCSKPKYFQTVKFFMQYKSHGKWWFFFYWKLNRSNERMLEISRKFSKINRI